MEETMFAVIELIKEGAAFDERAIERILRSANKGHHTRRVSKKTLLPYYLNECSKNSDTYKSWNIDEELHQQIVECLRAKPGRTASGVATVSVLMKPWPCAGNCIYCPNDIRMPKSYLSDEPACQRAEMSYFDPYIQVINRLSALRDMGHNTDKVELIVLGGTFDDYSIEYRQWFILQLFLALNEFSAGNYGETIESRESYYEKLGLSASPIINKQQAEDLQSELNSFDTEYNEAISSRPYWKAPEDKVLEDLSSTAFLEEEQIKNETSSCRCVGLVLETRPECINDDSLKEMRRLGCTKVQIGIQSLDEAILCKNSRTTKLDDIYKAFELLRQYGFKSHVHLMQNLPGANLKSDEQDFIKLMDDERLKPDEIKLYPCALVESANMKVLAQARQWQGYCTDDLIALLAKLISLTPRYTRISRMIRDIPSTDIIGGNNITNLRQLVENQLQSQGYKAEEIRLREIRTSNLDVENLCQKTTEYKTSNTTEYFLEYTDSNDRLAGFLRLSLPANPTSDAMIREVHVYGKVARIGEAVQSAQHIGLGKSLIEAAIDIAKNDNRQGIKVISAVGTRDYYRQLGFVDDDLYQRRAI